MVKGYRVSGRSRGERLGVWVKRSGVGKEIKRLVVRGRVFG